MIGIKGVQVRYGDKTVIPPLDLEVGSGEFVALLGPSGCGKSTLLRALGGFVPISSGSIVVDGRDVTAVEPERRGIGFVFQSYALFPHLTVVQNVQFGLKVHRLPRSEVVSRTSEVLELTGLDAFANATPSELSGGQQQRVAIARVLATKPSVMLMDEPLSNLDARLRVTLRDEIKRLHRELGVTTVYVTHDQEEALALADRVAVMNSGRIEQVDSPHAVYHSPVNRYVGEFVGSIDVLESGTRALFGVARGGQLALRPERLRLADGAGLDCVAGGTVTDAAFLGSTTRYRVEIGGQGLTMLAGSDRNAVLHVGDEVRCGFDLPDLIELSA
ncbi:ABC transporter ATP-binding protein [Rhodococcus sp. TAF43]|uniref:ABC transporter ATP-binding protein n=1 Tax=unclassified Rhodococcus (in: high G+C Gram-positive bacteria) TaxID=192944 RepID=UPI00158431E9|nr:ABC transporter ATP-binding protein [Rhodococcus sp. W8901]QKT10691.1 ABC transporter ATP-binding protein [Rhodococcus sp. W8901]